MLVVAIASLLAAAPQADMMTPSITASTAEDHQALLERFQQRIDEIEGKIVLTREKVNVLRDTVLSGEVSKSRSIILHRNAMGGSFVLEKATYLLDGGVIFTKEDTDGSLDAQKEFEVYNGAITPGEHEIAVSMIYGGSSYGFFTYSKGYKFKVESKYKFNVIDGRLTRLAVVSYTKGDITVAAGDRLSIRYDLEIGEVPANSDDKATPEVTPPTP